MLAQRNLLRQLTWGLLSGQPVAKAMGVPPLKPGDLGGIGDVHKPFMNSTLLWFCILAEAKAATGGVPLGPVRGRIVNETIIGLARANPGSYLTVKPGWIRSSTTACSPAQPQPEHHRNRSYTRAHVLCYAQVASQAPAISHRLAASPAGQHGADQHPSPGGRLGSRPIASPAEASPPLKHAKRLAEQFSEAANRLYQPTEGAPRPAAEQVRNVPAVRKPQDEHDHGA